MISRNLTCIPQNSSTKTTVWHTKFSHISHNFLNKMRLVPISHIWHTYPVFSVCINFYYLPIISGNLTPIPQNSITKTTVWHTKFSLISHNLLNKMRLVPIFIQLNAIQKKIQNKIQYLAQRSEQHSEQHSDLVFLVCLFSSFFHISHNFLNKMRLVPISHIWHTYPVFKGCSFSSFTIDFWKSDSYSTK